MSERTSASPAAWTFFARSAADTEALGGALGLVLEPGHVVGLVGELGAGKTCFVRGVASGAGVPEGAGVASPTFTLVNEYAGRILLAHIDLYRVGSADELVELGIDHYLGGESACLVEWFDRFPATCDAQRALLVHFAITSHGTRRIEACAVEARHRDLGQRWADRRNAQAERTEP